MKPEIFIFTNGHPTTLPAIECGAWLGASMQVPLRLIGVDENPSPAQIDEEVHPLEAVFEDAVQVFRRAGVKYQLEVLVGHAEEVIPKRAQEQNEMVAVGPLGRPSLKRLISGRSFRYLMEEVRGPLLYAPRVKLPMRKILVCLGGLGYTVTAQALAFRVAAAARAEVTLLMVVPPVELDYPEARVLRDNWHRLVETDTLAGRNLRQGLEIARTAGLAAAVTVRHGNVMDEILSEVKTGNYDLLCMGSPFSSTALRQLYTPKITAKIAENDLVPVLTARFARDG